MPPSRILVTDGDNRSALAATRSLGKHGHAVIVGAERRKSLAAASRFASGSFAYPDPVHRPDEFVAAVAAAAAAESIHVVMPMTEITTLLLARRRSALPARCALPFAEAAAIDAASDKAHVVELARELGVPVPESSVALSAAEARERAPALAYPIVVKPVRSRVLTAAGWVSNRVQYAHDAPGLRKLVGDLPSEAFPVLLQERISGPGVGLFACYDRGQPIAVFAHRRIREKPPSGGVSVLRESAPADPQAIDFAHRLLGSLDWHGVAMVEFKQDQRDGALRLMEINARFWGSLQLAIDAGVDFPGLLVRLATGNAGAPAGPYRVGVRSRWFLGDLDALASVCLNARATLNLPAGFPSRARLLWDFLHLWGRDLHYEVLTIDDPRPGWLELRRWLRGD